MTPNGTRCVVLQQAQPGRPGRATLSGLSLLLVVALAFQASAGAMERTGAVKEANRSAGTVRHVVEVSQRRTVVVQRRQRHIPSIVSDSLPTVVQTGSALAVRLPADPPIVRRPMPHMTDLPPPAKA